MRLDLIVSTTDTNVRRDSIILVPRTFEDGKEKVLGMTLWFQFWRLLGVEDTEHVTIERRLINQLFSLFSSFFGFFLLYSFM